MSKLAPRVWADESILNRKGSEGTKVVEDPNVKGGWSGRFECERINIFVYRVYTGSGS